MHDGVDLDQRTARQAGDAERGARRVGHREIGRHDFVDAREVAEVGEVNRELDDVVGISMNHPLSQKAFADFLKLNLPLLSDFPEGKTSQAYGVFNGDRRLAMRSYFIVDKQGVVRYKKVLKQGDPLVSNDELLAEVKKLGKS